MNVHVLLVEPDEELLCTLQRYLTRCGYQVSTTTDGPQCIARLRKRAPDLLVLEPELPDGWGERLLTLLSDNRGKAWPPVIALSRGNPGRIASAVYAYHIKPISMSVLVNSIEAVLHLTRPEMAERDFVPGLET